jgi:RNA polymerase sigma-70 factor (ECF subfamily)
MAVEFIGEYHAHREHLQRYLASITHDRDLADDAAQEACIRLAREMSLSRTPRYTRAWLNRVGRNYVIDNARRQQRTIKLQDRLWDSSVGMSAEDEYLLSETRLELGRALAQINPVDRDALQMAAEGFSCAEIAAALGITEGAVRVRMCRARGRLRDLLQRVP